MLLSKIVSCTFIILLGFIYLPNAFQEPQHVQSYNIEFIIDTSHLLVGINSAANFFLYLILRKNFRAATWRILSCKPQVIRSPRTQFSTYNQTASRNTLRISQGDTIYSCYLKQYWRREISFEKRFLKNLVFFDYL